MKILILDWDSFGKEYIIDEFIKAGAGTTVYPWPFGSEDMRENEKLESALEKKIKEENAEIVFSLNFFPVAAKVCCNCRIKYISWVYDTPFLLLYSMHIKYDTNMIFLFDKSQYNEFRKNGIGNVYYLPLAAPVEVYDRIVRNKDERYCSDISFVGSTYKEEQQDFFRLFKGISPYAEGYLEGIMKMQKRIYGEFILEELLSERILSELRSVCPVPRGNDEWESEAWIYANYFLARKLTGEERMEILGILSQKYTMSLYTSGETPELQDIRNLGPVDYMTQMPQIFKNTKINLNMTLRSIHSGIPLRAMDIMGCGGFLLTNYQEDFMEFFEPDVDFVYYLDNEDLLYKVGYYLSHEEERRKIAQNGYEKVKAAHTYRHRIRTMLDMLNI